MPDKTITTEPATPTLREMLSDAIRYWEPRRLFYNGALLLVVAGCFAAGWPESKQLLQAEIALGVFILAVLANVAYCAVYLPDIAIQHSAMRNSWLRWRWVLLLVGTLFASAITYFVVAGMLGFGVIKD
jgi:hypothetical protein